MVYYAWITADSREGEMLKLSVSLALTVIAPAGDYRPVLPTSPAAAHYQTLYDRLDQANKTHSPIRSLTGPAPEMTPLRTIVGSWRGDYHIFATPRRQERHRAGVVRIGFTADKNWLLIDGDWGSWHDRFFLGFDRIAKLWRLVEVEHPEIEGGAILPSRDAWTGGRLTFEATPAKLEGVSFLGRVSLIRVDAKTLRILWEERLTPGLWVAVDEQVLKRSS